MIFTIKVHFNLIIFSWSKIFNISFSLNTCSYLSFSSINSLLIILITDYSKVFFSYTNYTVPYEPFPISIIIS